jgi:hypothetical protein
MANIFEFPRPSAHPTVDASAFSQPHFAQLIARTRTIISSSAKDTQSNGREASNLVSIGETRRFDFPYRADAAS